MSKNTTISLCMIVKNEEETLERCLKSVEKVVDEFIIVDTGSTDGTKDICKKFNAKIYDFKWIDDFAAARNFAFSKATKNYILWLDGDDYFTDENIERFVKLKENFDDNVDAVAMEYSLSRDEQGNTTYSLKRNRLAKREKSFKWIGRIHEYLEVYGNIIHSDVVVYHGKVKAHGNRNLEIFRDMEEKGQEFSTRDTYYFANELYYNGFYKEASAKYEKFIDSGLGWVEDVKTATANLVLCYTHLNDREKRKRAILKTFEIDTPRADLCCRLGEYFMEEEKFKQAAFWYKVAMSCTHDKNNLGVDQRDYYTWIPAIQLCVCYSRLGEYETAYYYNELTAAYVKDTTKVLHNRNYLREKLKEINRPEPEFNLRIVDRRVVL